MFKAGDEVICVDDTDLLLKGSLLKGHLYTIQEIYMTIIFANKNIEVCRLKDHPNSFMSWRADRFKLANSHILKKRLGLIDEEA